MRQALTMEDRQLFICNIYIIKLSGKKVLKEEYECLKLQCSQENFPELKRVNLRFDRK